MAMLAACGPSQQDRVARGKYLVSVIGCSDCHTPGGFSPKPDMSRFLGGSDSDFIMTGMGTYTPPNLTPDKATGIGTWTTQQIETAFTTGVTPTGRVLSPAMPWSDFANMSKDDALDVALYLQSLPAVSHQVPGPQADRPCMANSEECIVLREAPAGAPAAAPATNATAASSPPAPAP
jgi:mono/diheme cytochrome c family protein